MSPQEIDLCQQCFERWPEIRPTRPAIIGPRKYTLQRSGSGWSWVCGAASVPAPNRDAYNACRVALEDECLRREMCFSREMEGDKFMVGVRRCAIEATHWRYFKAPTILEACARALLGDGG